MSAIAADKLVKMANQIAVNFDYGEDKSKAVAGVVDHLTRFWNSAMRAEIVAQYHRDPTVLNAVARLAVEKLAEQQRTAA